MSDPAIDPTTGQLARLTGSSDTGPIVMVNLLRFKREADGIDAGASGAEAYGRYGAAVAPLLEKAGGRVLSAAVCEESIIGPEAREWDMVLLVEYPSREAFLGMVSDPAYQEVVPHRTAGVADSRLILSKSA